jgi:HEPN domain-containing protein
MAQDRATFQQLAEIRLEEARLLLKNGQPSGAYYLAGYAIECALKAKIASQFRADEIPDKTLVNNVYKHDLNELLSLANLREEQAEAVSNDSELRRYWTITTRWKAETRYKLCSLEEATDMLEAVGGDRGLMQWLRSRW